MASNTSNLVVKLNRDLLPVLEGLPNKSAWACTALQRAVDDPDLLVQAMRRRTARFAQAVEQAVIELARVQQRRDALADDDDQGPEEGEADNITGRRRDAAPVLTVRPHPKVRSDLRDLSRALGMSINEVVLLALEAHAWPEEPQNSPTSDVFSQKDVHQAPEKASAASRGVPTWRPRGV